MIFSEGLVVLFAAVPIGIAAYLLKSVSFRSPWRVFIRGAKVVSQRRAQAELHEQAEKEVSEGFRFAGCQFPRSALSKGFLVQGVPGAAKTWTVIQFLESTLPLIGRGEGFRACLWDPKGEWLPYCHGSVNPSVPIWSLNSVDEGRGVAWDIASDVRSAAEAEQIGTSFVPDANKTDPFWDAAAREILVGVIIVLQLKHPGDWTLADLLRILSSLKWIVKTLKRCRETAHLVELYLKSKRTALSILATLNSHLRRLRVVASCWEHCDMRISTREFLREEAVLLLPHDDAHAEALRAINGVLLKQLSERTLSANDPSKTTLFVFDEMRLLVDTKRGVNVVLVPLLLNGRSAGSSVTCCIQGMTGLEEAMGERVAHELASALQIKLFLRAGSFRDAKFASEQVGRAEMFEYAENWSHSVTYGRSPSRSETHGVTEHVVLRDQVLAEEMMNLPVPTRENPVATGYGTSPYTGPFESTFSFAETAKWFSEQPPLPLVRRPDQHQLLRPFSAEAMRKFRLI